MVVCVVAQLWYETPPVVFSTEEVEKWVPKSEEENEREEVEREVAMRRKLARQIIDDECNAIVTFAKTEYSSQSLSGEDDDENEDVSDTELDSDLRMRESFGDTRNRLDIAKERQSLIRDMNRRHDQIPTFDLTENIRENDPTNRHLRRQRMQAEIRSAYHAGVGQVYDSVDARVDGNLAAPLTSMRMNNVELEEEDVSEEEVTRIKEEKKRRLGQHFRERVTHDVEMKFLAANLASSK